MGHTFSYMQQLLLMVQLSPRNQSGFYAKDGKIQLETYQYCSGYQYKDQNNFRVFHTHFSGKLGILIRRLFNIQIVGKLN